MNITIFICLAAAHILGDFLLQTSYQAAQKHRISVLARHAGVQALLSYVLLGVWSLFWLPLIIFITHGLIDLVKAKSYTRSLKALFWDQFAHAVIIVLLAWLLSSKGYADQVFWIKVWGSLYLQGLVLLAGFVFSVYGAGIIVMIALKPYAQQLGAEQIQSAATANAVPDRKGKIAGQLERGLIFFSMLSGYYAGPGLLLAVKCVFRIFKYQLHKSGALNYFLIGTLISFGCGLCIAFCTMYCLSYLGRA